MKRPIFTGSATAIVTPFSDGKPDIPRFRALVERQIESGTDAIVVCGTTGEASALSPAERVELIAACAGQTDHRVPVIAGSGANCTETAIRLSQEACRAGADALLLVTPYYNKASQRGLIEHFTAIADRVDRPAILYNVPSRTGVSCTAETYRALSTHPNIVGVKEASGSFALLQDTRNLCPDDFYIWSGNDEDTVPMMALGAQGVISVVSNVIPREMHELTALCRKGRFLEAGRMQLRMSPLIRALFCEVNPIPVKAALAKLGLCENALRLPLCPLGPDGEETLERAMRAYGLLD